MKEDERTQLQTAALKQFDFDLSQQSSTKLNRKQLKLARIKQNRSQFVTLDSDNKIQGHIDFKPVYKQSSKQYPGVGAYDIRGEIVKPSFQTFEKHSNVILVKVNHIGGTSSFNSEEERFNEKQSIYQNSHNPGPGAYNTIAVSKEKQRKQPQYSQNYRIINQMIQQSRERSQSIPNYIIDSKGSQKYNGMPQHLQHMYHQLYKHPEIHQRRQSLPLQHFLQRKKQQKLPMRSDRYATTDNNKTDYQFKTIEEGKRSTRSKFTETMCRMDEERKKETERNKKIKAILEDRNRRELFDSNERIQPKKRYVSKKGQVKHLVNLLFDQKRYSRSLHKAV